MVKKERCFACLMEGKDEYFIKGKVGDNAIPLCARHTLEVMSGELKVEDLEKAFNEKR